VIKSAEKVGAGVGGGAAKAPSPTPCAVPVEIANSSRADRLRKLQTAFSSELT